MRPASTRRPASRPRSASTRVPAILASKKPSAQPRASLLEQAEERAAPPVLGRLALGRRTVFDQLRLALVTLAPPADDAAFMHRMQGIDDDRGARYRQSGRYSAATEPIDDLGLAIAGEPGLSQPVAKLG